MSESAAYALPLTTPSSCAEMPSLCELPTVRTFPVAASTASAQSDSCEASGSATVAVSVPL